ISRYESISEINSRLDYIDFLYGEMYAGRYQYYKSRITWPKSIRKLFDSKGFLMSPPVLSEPMISVGRGQRLALNDGRHRICLAKVANVKEILVRVAVVHADTMG